MWKWCHSSGKTRIDEDKDVLKRYSQVQNCGYECEGRRTQGKDGTSHGLYKDKCGTLPLCPWVARVSKLPLGRRAQESAAGVSRLASIQKEKVQSPKRKRKGPDFIMKPSSASVKSVSNESFGYILRSPPSSGVQCPAQVKLLCAAMP